MSILVVGLKVVGVSISIAGEGALKDLLAASIFLLPPISHSLSPPFTSLPHIMLQLHFLYCVPVDIKNVYLQVKSVVLQLQRVATRGVALRPAASCCYHGNRRWMATGPPPLTVLTEEEEMMKESGVLRSCCCIQSCFSTTFKVFYL